MYCSIYNRLMNIYSKDLRLDGHIYKKLEKRCHCHNLIYLHLFTSYMPVLACRMTGTEDTH